MPGEQPDQISRVTTLELFFDLVFVFTITQFVQLLLGDLTWTALWHVMLMLALIFWMYDGYVWLTNHVPARGLRRQGLLIGGMACYLVLSIAIPDAFETTGLMFGIAYLLINVIHAGLFIASAPIGAAAAMRTIGPANVGGAIVVLIGGVIGGDVQAILWTLVVIGQWLLTRPGSFELGAAHFVERHGLLIIVAIGESVVAIGVGARELAIDAETALLVCLGLALNAGCWWAYFGNDDDADAQAAFDALAPERRGIVGLRGFGYGHFVMLLGIILLAVGIEEAIAHPADELELAYALALSGGIAVFLAGDVIFRRSLGLKRTLSRIVTAVAVMLAVPVATGVCGEAGLAAATALFVGALVAEGSLRAAPVNSGHS